MPSSVYDDLLATSHEAAQAELDAVRQRLVAEGFTVETAIRDGFAADQILDLADEHRVFAIVMATHGRGDLRRLLLGSVAERIIQQATLPVLLVPAAGHAVAPDHLRRVLVPLDGSPLAERAIEVAQDVIAADGTVSLVRAVPPVERLHGIGELTETVKDEPATHRAVEEATAYLEALRARLARPSSPPRSSVREGRPADTIRVAAAADLVDLIVMATHGSTGPARWRLGSVADQVVRQAECPVLLVSVRMLAARAVGPFTVGDLMTRDLATVSTSEPPIAALRKLLRRRVSGAPVVDANGQLVGVISEYDLLRWQAQVMEELSRDEAPSADTSARRLETGAVGHVMTHPVVSLDAATPLSAALRLFIERRFRRLPVVRDGRLVGVIARADLLMALAERTVSAGNDSARSG
jgi:nucleotide-binding universal stress UspA family protein/predicted transcriptional regulator